MNKDGNGRQSQGGRWQASDGAVENGKLSSLEGLFKVRCRQEEKGANL